MYFFNNLNNFINLFINIITFVMTIKMLFRLMFVYNRATKMIMLVFLFVLNSNVATKIAAIIKVIVGCTTIVIVKIFVCK